jgi:hypothetical protein
VSTPESKPIKKIILAKLDVAERQLDTAIWLWFNDGDTVSINQLAGAAFGVLDDLYHHQKKRRPVPFGHTPKGKTPRQWTNFIKAAQDFAKHARKDAEDVHPYSPDFTECYLFLAVMAHKRFVDLADDSHGLRSLFILRYALTTPALFAGDELQLEDERLDIERLKNLSKSEFFQELGGDFIGNPPRPD